MRKLEDFLEEFEERNRDATIALMRDLVVYGRCYHRIDTNGDIIYIPYREGLYEEARERQGEESAEGCDAKDLQPLRVTTSSFGQDED